MNLSKSLAPVILLLLVSIASRSVEFLPVDEAYQYSYYLDEQELVIDWIITPEYYLYKDRFKYKTDSDVVTHVQYLETWIEKYDPVFEEVMNIYYDAMSVRLRLAPEPSEFEINLTYQGCADAGLCYPPQNIKLTVNQIERTVEQVAVIKPTSDRVQKPSNSAASSQVSFLIALAFAFAGGMILNLMPCVFPVLSLKALSLVESRQNSYERRKQSGFYTLGVVLSFMLVGLVPVLFKGVGDWIGWGFQLQSPTTIGLLLLLFFVLALNMFGLVHFGGRYMGIGQSLTEKSGSFGSFFTGVLATVVAAPCVAPFMGSAIGFALAQPLAVGLSVFAVMGLGMATPMVLISWSPRIVNWLPKPGPWMETFKQFMAFPLLLTVFWLLFVLVEMKGSSAVLYAGLGLLLVAISSWPAMGNKTNDSEMFKSIKLSLRVLFWVAALGLILKPVNLESEWEDYSEALVSGYVDQNIPVFVDVTAAWCITCKVNEQVALSGQEFFALAAKKNIKLVKADWTNPSPEVDYLIETYGQSGVPLYLIYSQGDITVLPQILTPDMIREAFASL